MLSRPRPQPYAIPIERWHVKVTVNSNVNATIQLFHEFAKTVALVRKHKGDGAGSQARRLLLRQWRNAPPEFAERSEHPEAVPPSCELRCAIVLRCSRCEVYRL